jgi:hypothetical protein
LSEKNWTHAWLHRGSQKNPWQYQLPYKDPQCKTIMYIWRWPLSPKHVACVRIYNDMWHEWGRRGMCIGYW